MTGLGRTLHFVPARTRLHGLGQDGTVPPPDLGPLPVPGGPLPETFPTPAPQPPPGFFTFPPPVIPPPTTVPVTPPVINVPPGGPLPVPQIVFPSGGAIAPYGMAPAPPPVSWLDQQMIAGVSNKTLALLAIGGVFFASIAGAKRRR